MPDVGSDDRRARFEDEALVHLDALFAFARRLAGGDDARAEDLVQATCLRAFERWDQYQPGTDCRAWLMTILRTTFVNEYHSRQRRPTPVDYDDVGERSVFEGRSPADPEARFFEEIIDD
ncbi:MAG TPA: sigma factor, partial [Gemmatimonadota bacterium]|nr:sigma factor [Gemmatimonadota bacterium]